MNINKITSTNKSRIYNKKERFFYIKSNIRSLNFYYNYYYNYNYNYSLLYKYVGFFCGKRLDLDTNSKNIIIGYRYKNILLDIKFLIKSLFILKGFLTFFFKKSLNRYLKYFFYKKYFLEKNSHKGFFLVLNFFDSVKQFKNIYLIDDSIREFFVGSILKKKFLSFNKLENGFLTNKLLKKMKLYFPRLLLIVNFNNYFNIVREAKIKRIPTIGLTNVKLGLIYDYNIFTNVEKTFSKHFFFYFLSNLIFKIFMNFIYKFLKKKFYTVGKYLFKYMPEGKKEKKCFFNKSFKLKHFLKFFYKSKQKVKKKQKLMFKNFFFWFLLKIRIKKFKFFFFKKFPRFFYYKKYRKQRKYVLKKKLRRLRRLATKKLLFNSGNKIDWSFLNKKFLKKLNLKELNLISFINFYDLDIYEQYLNNRGFYSSSLVLKSKSFSINYLFYKKKKSVNRFYNLNYNKPNLYDIVRFKKIPKSLFQKKFKLIDQKRYFSSVKKYRKSKYYFKEKKKNKKFKKRKFKKFIKFTKLGLKFARFFFLGPFKKKKYKKKQETLKKKDKFFRLKVKGFDWRIKEINLLPTFKEQRKSFVFTRKLKKSYYVRWNLFIKKKAQKVKKNKKILRRSILKSLGIVSKLNFYSKLFKNVKNQKGFFVKFIESDINL